MPISLLVFLTFEEVLDTTEMYYRSFIGTQPAWQERRRGIETATAGLDPRVSDCICHNH